MSADRVYFNKGWAGFGDWLGTSSTATQYKQYKSFSDAREFVHKLGLASNTQWRTFVHRRLLPTDIPASPNVVYRDKGWAGLGDWLGTGTIAPFLKKYRPFPEARVFARSLGLKSRKQWSLFCKSGQLPADMPAAPQQVYADEGWAGVGDWLGTGIISPCLRKYRPFKEARAFVRTLGLRNRKEWSEFTKGKKFPTDIPVNPNQVYEDEGWAGIGDWLGTGSTATFLRKFQPFTKAQSFARGLGLKSYKEWIEFSKSDRRPPEIPSNPQLTYKGKGWKGYGDWLGTRNLSPFKRKYLPFKKARAFVRSLGLKNQREWHAYSRSGQRPTDIPSNPSQIYHRRGWLDLRDWLGIKTK